MGMQQLPKEIQALLGLRLTAAQIEQFELYQRELIAWNRRANLTAISEPEQIRVKHFLDSVSCLLAIRNPSSARIADVGTGAGFPGVPLKILCPQFSLTLFESVAKKTAFLEHIVQVLRLKNLEIAALRAETAGHLPQYRQQFDWAVARAVAPLSVLAEYLLPLVKIGGHMLAQKGENAPGEVQEAHNAIAILGGRLKELVPVALPGIPEERYLVVIEKIAATPDRYPRREGIPAKRPL